MSSGKSYILTVLKLFICIFSMVVIIFAITGLITEKYMHWSYIISFSSTVSLLNALKYKEVTVELPIKDRALFIEELKRKLIHGQWKIINEGNDIFILKPKFDFPYSWLYKERIEITIEENHASLKGAKLYIDNIKRELENKKLFWDNRGIRYSVIAVCTLIIMVLALINLGLIDRLALKKTYHEFQIRNIEKINFKESFTLGNRVENIHNYGGAVNNGNNAYYVGDSNGIYKTNKNFDYEEHIVYPSSSANIWYLNAIEDWLFYREGKAIYRVKTDGSNKKRIFNLGYTLDLHLLDNWLYFIYVEDDYKVYKMTVNGEEIQRVIDYPVSSIAIYDGKLYYSYGLEGIDYLKAMDLKGEKDELIGHLRVRDMIIENNIIYYIDYYDNKLYQYDLSNKQRVSLVKDEILKFTKDKDRIYFIGVEEGEFREGKGLYKLNLLDDKKETIHNYRGTARLDIVGDWILYESSNQNRQPPTLKRINRENGIIIEME